MLVVASVAAVATSLDLAQQLGRPAWCPQKLTLSNSTAAALVAVMVDEDGKPQVVTVPAQNSLVITRPIRTLTAAGSGAVQVIAEWFDPDGSNYINDDS